MTKKNTENNNKYTLNDRRNLSMLLHIKTVIITNFEKLLCKT